MRTYGYEELLKDGYGIGFHPIHKDFRPFFIDDTDGIIAWWDDPQGIADEDFNSAILKLDKIVSTTG